MKTFARTVYVRRRKEAPLEFRILGELEVRDGEKVLELHGSRERELLAYFLLHANELVASDRLIDELWGETPPATVSSALHVYISRLRKLLGSDGTSLVTKRPGYVLEVEPQRIDLWRFEQLLAEGRRARADGDAERAAERLREALAVWRGPALADLSKADWAQREIDRLEELRLATLEERIDAELGLGRHAELVPELEGLVALHPLRERLRGQLIVALYRSDRQADALRVYADTRRALAEELGLEPSAGLRRLEQAILVQDPALDLPRAERGSPRQKPRRPARQRAALAVATLLVVGGAAAAIAFMRGASRAPVHVVPGSVAVIDARTNRLTADIPLHARPSGIAAGAGSVWVTDYDDSTLVRIDPASERIIRTIGVANPLAVAVGGGQVWVGNPARLVAVNPDFDNITSTTRLTQRIAGFREGFPGYGTVAAIATGPAGVWMAHTVSALSEIDPRNGSIMKSVTLADPPAALAVGTDTIWVAAPATERLLQVDAATGSITDSIAVPGLSLSLQYVLGNVDIGNSIVLGDDSLWVPVDGGVRRIDPITGATTTMVKTGTIPLGAAIGAGSVWVANYSSGTVSRIDPRTNRVVATVRTGNNPTGIVVAGNRVWVTVN